MYQQSVILLNVDKLHSEGASVLVEEAKVVMFNDL